jgi:hypothetical protein
MTRIDLVEVIVAMLIMATLAAGLLSMSAIALTQSENQGHPCRPHGRVRAGQDGAAPRVVLRQRHVGHAGVPGDTLEERDWPSAAATIRPRRSWLRGLSRRERQPAREHFGNATGQLVLQAVWQITPSLATLKEIRVTATVARASDAQEADRDAGLARSPIRSEDHGCPTSSHSSDSRRPDSR